MQLNTTKYCNNGKIIINQPIHNALTAEAEHMRIAMEATAITMDAATPLAVIDLCVNLILSIGRPASIC